MNSTHKITLPGTVHELIPLEDGMLWLLVQGSMTRIGCVVSRDGVVEEKRIADEGVHSPWVVRFESGELLLSRGTIIYELTSEKQLDLSRYLKDDEIIESFVMVSGGFVVSTSAPQTKGPRPSRLLRIDTDGFFRWSCRIPFDPVAFEGVAEMRAETGFKVEQKAPWRPRRWDSHFVPEPLIVGRDAVLAGYADESGVGRHYMIDLETGELRWVSKSRPMSRVAVGREGFLIGSQGYGAFSSELRGSDGTCYQAWDSHGLPIIDNHITIVEMSNDLSVPQYVTRLEPDGTVIRGAQLPGYYSTHPVLSADGRIAFFRAGRLLVVDPDLKATELIEEHEHKETAVWTRTLLLDDGTIAFGVQDKLWLVESDLAPMADAPWPCGSGTVGANPVVTS